MALNKGAVFTDIHHGKRANDETHNIDCSDFVDWFCSEVKKDPEIDHIMFLGDWYESRNAINISTMNYSYYNAKKLNELGLPVYFIVGNHDLYHKYTREVHSIVKFREFSNFHIIDQPTVVDDIGTGALICPYMFREEYEELKTYSNIDTWWGHFEFRGFVVTGETYKMPTGPDPIEFIGPKHIISGHFHKRQAFTNIVYVGNTFPMNFNDAGDVCRGYMTYKHDADEMMFHDWTEGPQFIKTNLTEVLDGIITINEKTNIRCLVDVPITFEESQIIRQTITEKYNPREFTLEEPQEIADAIINTKAEVDDETLASTNELVVQMLNNVESKHINNETLIRLYKELKKK